MRDFNQYANVIESMIRKHPEALWRDLRQECALKFFEARERYQDKPDDEFFLIVVKSMYHQVLDYVKSEQLNEHLSIDELAFEEDNDRVTFADLIEEPSVLINEIEARDFISKWDIPERDMTILQYYYVEGFSPREIADMKIVNLEYRQIYNIISKYQ